MMTLSELQALKDSGAFHHATYRDHGTVWEGLHIYVRHASGFGGYSHAGAFFKDSADLPAAEAIARGTGISGGAYGHG